MGKILIESKIDAQIYGRYVSYDEGVPGFIHGVYFREYDGSYKFVSGGMEWRHAWLGLWPRR